MRALRNCGAGWRDGYTKLNYLGIARVFLPGAQIFVEHHADIADQHAPLGGNGDPFRRES